MAFPVDSDSRNHRRQFWPRTTPYADLPSRITDIAVNDGTWNVVGIGATPHQSVGSLSDAIVLEGQMTAIVQMPADIWNANNVLSYSWTFAACIVDPSCPNSDYSFRMALGGSSIQEDIPTCPSISNDINYSGPISLGDESKWPNPVRFSIFSPMASTGAYCNVTVGRMSFVVNSSGGGGGGSSDSSGGTSATVITTTDASGSTIVTTSTPATGTISGSGTRTPTATGTANSTVTGVSTGSGGIVLTTKLPQVSTLPDGAVVTLADPSTGISQPAANAENAKKARMAGIIGGVCGGLALIIFFAFLFWWWRRRRNKLWEEGASSAEGFSSSNNDTPTDETDSSNTQNIPTNALSTWPGWQAQPHPHYPYPHILQSPPTYSDAPPLYQSPNNHSRRISMEASDVYYQGLGLGLTLHPPSGSVSGSDYHSASYTSPSDGISDSPYTPNPNAPNTNTQIPIRPTKRG